MEKKQFFKENLIVLFLFILYGHPLFSEPLKIEEGAKYNVIPHTEYFRDSENKYSIQNIQEAEFIMNADGKSNFGRTSDTIWLRLKLDDSKVPLSSQWIISVEYPSLDYVNIYFPDRIGQFIKKEGGDQIPFSRRDIKSRFLNFLLPYTLVKNPFIYFEVKTSTSAIIPIYLSPLKLFQKQDHDMQIIMGVYFGIILIMILYNFFLFISIREISYLYYVLMTSGIFFYMLAFHGFGYEYIWGNSPYFQNKATVASSVFLRLFLFLFTMNFLDLKNYTPRIYYLYVFFCITTVLELILYILYHSSILVVVISYEVFIHSFLLPITGFLCLIQGNRAARYYLIGWLPLTITFTLTVAIILGFLKQFDGMHLHAATQISHVFEALFFSLALADRVNILKEQKNAAEEKIRENLEKSNIELEKKVEERTTALNNTLRLIKQDMNFAKKIQARILPNEFQKVSNVKIISRYLPMEEVGGDFFDIVKLSNGKIRVMIADATGHGVQAALITMLIKSEYEVLKETADSPSVLLEKLNFVFFKKYSNVNSFFTCFIVDIDLRKKTILYASAGHSSQFLIQKDCLQVLSKTGKIPGVLQDSRFKEIEIPFEERDKILLFTDGLFEEFNLNEEEFGEESLFQLVNSIRDKGVEEIVNFTIQKMNEFLNGSTIQDDITIIGIEFTD